MIKVSSLEARLECAQEDNDKEMIEIWADDIEQANEQNERILLDMFKAEILPLLPAHDSIMQREEYNNFIDSWMKDGYLSESFVNEMDNPF